MSRGERLIEDGPSRKLPIASGWDGSKAAYSFSPGSLPFVGLHQAKGVELMLKRLHRAPRQDGRILPFVWWILQQPI